MPILCVSGPKSGARKWAPMSRWHIVCDIWWIDLVEVFRVRYLVPSWLPENELRCLGGTNQSRWHVVRDILMIRLGGGVHSWLLDFVTFGPKLTARKWSPKCGGMRFVTFWWIEFGEGVQSSWYLVPNWLPENAPWCLMACGSWRFHDWVYGGIKSSWYLFSDWMPINDLRHLDEGNAFWKKKICLDRVGGSF